MNRLERIILSARHHVTTFTHLLCESAQRDYTALRDQLDNVTPLMAGTENAGLKTQDQICRGKGRTGKHGNIVCVGNKT